MTAFAPTVDGFVLPDSVPDAAAANPVPLVIGTTRDEMRLFTVLDPTRSSLPAGVIDDIAARRFGADSTRALAAYRQRDPGCTDDDISSAIATDETFRGLAWRLSSKRLASGHPTWMYEFAFASTAFGGALGACHGVDVPFAFHNLDRKGVVALTGDSPERSTVADAFAGAIAEFARHGDPGWPAYDATRRATMRFDGHSQVVDDPDPELRQLWS